MAAAAVYMQSGSTLEQIAALADQGCLMYFHTPRSADENSPLALLTVREGNKLKTFYTVDFGCFHPEMALLRARNFAREHAVPVINAVSLSRSIIPGPSRDELKPCRGAEKREKQPKRKGMAR